MAKRQFAGSLAGRLKRLGLADELRRLRLLRDRRDAADGFTLDELHEFCASFEAGDGLKPIQMPTIEQLKCAASSMRRARRDPVALLPLLPPSLRASSVAGEVPTATLVSLMNDCAAAIDTVRKQIGTAREKVNPIERIFRAKWELKARMRSGKPLHSIGTILFNATFGARVDQASYTRMVRRDRQTFKVPSRERDRTAKPNKSR